MPVRLIEVDSGKLSVLDNLLQLYIHEMSRHRPTPFGPDGRYPTPQIAEIGDGRATGLLILVKGLLAGFAVVRRQRDDQGRLVSDVHEFFLAEAYRHLGFSEDAACLMFKRQPGWWRCRLLSEDAEGVQFWRTMLPKLTGAMVHEMVSSDGEETHFEFCVVPDAIAIS